MLRGVLWHNSYRAVWTAIIHQPGQEVENTDSKIWNGLLQGVFLNHFYCPLGSQDSQEGCILTWVFIPAHLCFLCIADYLADFSQYGNPGGLSIKCRWLLVTEDYCFEPKLWFIQSTVVYFRTRHLIFVFWELYIYILYLPPFNFLKQSL